MLSGHPSPRINRRYSLFTLVSVVGFSVAVLVYNFLGQRSTVAVLGWVSNSTCQDYSDDSVAPAQVLSKELVVRRVLFDPRRRNGHDNAIVFVMEAKGLTLNADRFLGCQVGNFFSNQFHFWKPRNYKWYQTTFHCKSTLAVIDCYSIQEARNGDWASLYYKRTAGVVVKVPSLKPLLILEPKAAVNSSTLTTLACLGPIFAADQHSPADHGMLYHWLRYHKAIGIDHVHMTIENTFVRDGGLQNEVMQQAIREGYLSIDFWPKWLNFTEVFNTMSATLQVCLHRFQGVYDYVLFVDSDDFFVPLKSKSIKDYLRKWCTGKNASCRFGWHQFFPDCGWDPNSIGKDGNFTAAITCQQVWKRPETKSAHQLKAVADAGIHLAKALVDGYKPIVVPPSEAYFAHVRFGWRPKGGCANH